MIPIRDTIPCYCRPYVTWTLMAINILMFIWTLLMPEQQKQLFLYQYGFVAARYTFPEWALQMHFPNDHYFSFVSSMFLHGGWMHIIMNMLFLWIFADNIEDRMGPLRFLMFYFICGLIACYLQYFFNAESVLPVVGASGAIAGVMGAYFFIYPYARIIIWVPLLFLPIFFEIPAIAFLGFWVIMQLMQITIANVDTQSIADVAWWGHLGGFVAGLFLHKLFMKSDMDAPFVER